LPQNNKIMIRTVVTPKNTDIHLSIPENYIGKQIEILLYTTDEVKEEKNIKNNNVARFKGLLTNEEADKYNIYLKQARGEWDRDL
jgi:hypothetical protein